MFRRIFALMLLCLFLAGCSAPENTPVELTDETAVYEGEGYTLTYPACFELVGKTANMVNFAVPGGHMAFTLTAEDNPYGAHKIEEYPELMGIYSGVEILNAHSFGVDKFKENFLSAYYLYTMTEDTTYLLEYNFGGTKEQRAMAKLFAVELK